MTQPRRPRAPFAVIALLAIALCFLQFPVHRAFGGVDKTPAKKPAAAQSTLMAAEPISTKVVTPAQPVSSAHSGLAAAGTASPLASTGVPGPGTEPGDNGSVRPDVPESLPLALAATSAPSNKLSEGTATAEAPDLNSIPTGAGLPVVVDIATYFLEIRAFDDVKGEFEATIDLRLRWIDPRLRFRAAGKTSQYVEYRGKEAEARLEKLWSPTVDVDNRLETSGYVGHRLRVFSDGQVETIVRSTSRYKIDVNVQNFPFDVQALKLTMVVRDQTVDQVKLHFDKDDEEFSRASDDTRVESWGVGDVDLDADLLDGWNGDRYSRVTASLLVTRSASSGLTTIFIPLLASLLIPLLTLWMNRTNREGFEIEAFELANMGIGGLFSVIALSFAVSSSYSVIAGSDNTVTRLFALNYATLALSLAVVVVLYRFNLVQRLFGPYVNEQVFRFVLWAIPLLTFGTSIAFIFVAAS